MNPPLIRKFRLSPSGRDHGVRCDADGAFVGSVPLLKRARVYADEAWMSRNADELSADLSAQYGLPIDIASKSAGIGAIARALNAGAIAHAQLVTLHLKIPDPPTLTKFATSPNAAIALIRELHWSGLLKIWDPDFHPRWPGGTPDRQGGRFAPKGGEGEFDLAEAEPDEEEPERETGGQTEAESRAGWAAAEAAGREEDKEREAEVAGVETPRSQRSRISQAQRARDRRAYWKSEAEKDPLLRELEPEAYGESNLSRMKRGIGPRGDDGFTMEVHHPEGSPDESVEPMTRTEHRLGPNYLRNHPWLSGPKK